MASAIDRLKSWLGTTGLRQSNFPLYQILNALIDAVRGTQIVAETVTGGSGGGGGGLLNATYLTATNQTALLPNSRELVAGTGITFTDTPGQREVSSAAGNVPTFGVSEIDFGPTLCDICEFAVTGQTTIAADAQILVFLMGSTTVDSDEEDHLMAINNMTVVAGIPVAGVGFTIYAFVTQGLTQGKYNVQWMWSNP